nr:cobaltochelatase subunit CobN [Archaeoglobus fulgidus]
MVIDFLHESVEFGQNPFIRISQILSIFKADVIIHFGTHGYLEFRPGKGVGLSPSCWPEISVDDVPHLYVYNVSNPMEGVIAKRRSYATIVDHLYPPMSMANVLQILKRFYMLTPIH